MPRQPSSFEDRLLDELEPLTENALKRLADEQGPPPDSQKLTEADEDEAWETPDPNVEYESFAQQLMTQGLPPEVVQNLLLVKLRPEWAPLYSRPTQSAELAHMLARLAERPFRLSILEDIDDPDEMVAKAEQMDRRFQKRMTAAQEQAAMPMQGQAVGYGQPGGMQP